jgi:hypothetical protein
MKSIIISSILLLSYFNSNCQKIEFLKLKRIYTDNKEWKIHTNVGEGSLKRIFSDNSQWQVTLPKQEIILIKQSFSGDKTDWIISNESYSVNFAISFSNNFNEWRTGQEGNWIYLKTTFNNNFNEWNLLDDPDSFVIKTTFKDRSEWLVKDKLENQDLLTKVSLICIPILMQ